jgi:hypothetical protein
MAPGLPQQRPVRVAALADGATCMVRPVQVEVARPNHFAAAVFVGIIRLPDHFPAQRACVSHILPQDVLLGFRV